MKRNPKTIWTILLTCAAMLALSGCASLLEEDPNEQQIPWATPANWEGQLPGMPNTPG
ncbi:MAG: hypothetical protein RL648_1774 [Verrucomicrobiota bacterium]|jgi:uncharacterized protein YceK